MHSRRKHLWNRLEGEAAQSPPNVDVLKALFDELARIECFWAFPGPEVVAQLCHYLECASYSLFTQLVHNVLTVLTSKQYRFRQYPYQGNLSFLDRPILHEHHCLISEKSRHKKPYCEVLIVHPMADRFKTRCQESLYHLRTPQDDFYYDILVVDTIQVAINAILNNPTIQVCILAHGYLEHDFTQLRPEMSMILFEQLESASLFNDMHHHIMASVKARMDTPFFQALQDYSKKPKGVFHALPLSRASSIQDSPWLQDMVSFYGTSIFMAETSSTQGGLDSLLYPQGVIKHAQEKAAAAFGAKRCFFVTVGSSTANKIILQATLSASDIVLITSDCHKSVSHGAMLSGAVPIFIAPYVLPDYDLYGAVTLTQIKQILFDLKAVGQLDKVKQITLTNSTFDGLIYDVEQMMMEILAIKPDIIFHFDEAWFAFAHFHPLYHGRTAMSAVRRIRQRLRSAEYRDFYAQWVPPESPQHAVNEPLYPDPDHAVIRVYVTQSTHKTLTAFRQGSMILIDDDDYDDTSFSDAYRMHTTTSPNYQILASLDLGRRQVSLEGFERVQDTLYLAYYMRAKITDTPQLNAYFKVLDTEDLVPMPHQGSIMVDPTRITLDIRNTNMTGSQFREHLMNHYDIQINKTSHTTALFMITIGSTQESIDHVIHVLYDIAARLKIKTPMETSVTEDLATLPEKRHFHNAFKMPEIFPCDAVKIRESYLYATHDDAVQHIPLTPKMLTSMEVSHPFVSAGFVTPYPPGSPLLVPGQLITYDIFRYLLNLNTHEIHGYRPDMGIKVFKPEFLETLT